jgi:hypothetical protein
MDLDFVSGLLLTAVVLAILGYLVYEIVPDGVGDPKRIRHYLADALSRHLASEAKSANDHLIGSIAKVIAHSDDGARPMKVRLGLEFWPARSTLSEEGRLPVGASVKVVAVEGPIVVVEAARTAVRAPDPGAVDARPGQ